MMKRKRLLLIGALAAVAAGIFLFWPRGPKEPVYQGKKLTQWVQEASRSYHDSDHNWIVEENPAANEAIAAIGTNALSWLIYEFNRPPPWWADAANRWAGKLNFKPLRVEPEDAHLGRVLTVFEHLGTDSGPAAPALAASLRHPLRGFFAESALRAAGAAGVPYLQQAADSGEPKATAHAVQGVVFLAERVPEAFDALFDMLTHTNRSVRNAAALRMADLKRQRDRSLPILTQMLSSRDAAERRKAAAALGSMYIEAKSAVPALVKLLSDRDRLVASAASNAVFRIDPAALPPRGP